MHKRFYITIGIVLAGIAAWQIFGFKELTIKEVEIPIHHVYGYEYAGYAQDKQVGDYQSVAKELFDKGKLKGNLGVWYFGDPDAHQEVIQIMIGAYATAPLTGQPSDIAYKVIKGGKAVRAIIDPYAIFGPNPAEVNEAILNYAKEKKIGSQAYLYSEKYIKNENGDPELWVEAYVTN